jgi:hypothetical protein
MPVAVLAGKLQIRGQQTTNRSRHISRCSVRVAHGVWGATEKVRLLSPRPNLRSIMRTCH